MSTRRQAPPISDYGLIGDCHSAALVSRSASIDWCCLPRFDSGSCFGRLLDWRRGGHCSITARGATGAAMSYVRDTLVLETSIETPGGEGRILDCFSMRDGGAVDPRREILRVVDCVRGRIDVDVCVRPRFDYGAVTPWLRLEAPQTFSAIGGDDGLVVWSDAALELGDGELHGGASLRGGDRARLSISFRRPERIDHQPPQPLDAHDVDTRLDATIDWWLRWIARVKVDGPDVGATRRSALTLKALTYAPTGAIVAAPTTSLPETPRGTRNWDYRYSWVRDATLSARALTELGCDGEAGRFRRFVVRSSAGRAADLQIAYGVGGERRLTEIELDLQGYRGAAPVRVGNAASAQVQLDAYGEILNLARRWHERGHSPDDDEWRFLAELVEAAVTCWRRPDCGIWEWRGRKRHFVHSKACCWAAIDRGLTLAEDCMRRAPQQRWRRARDAIREAIETRGYDQRRGVFVQAFGSRQLDAAALLLPVVGFVAWDDERMLRTADAIRTGLDRDGLLDRYRSRDGLPGQEAAFVACSFWLAECYARQGRLDAAQDAYDRTMAAASGLGLFAEQYDPTRHALRGNFPQGLTHLSQIAAAHALAAARAAGGPAGEARSPRALRGIGTASSNQPTKEALDMATTKQVRAARRNVSKAQRAATRKRTIASLPQSTRSELGKQAARGRQRGGQAGHALEDRSRQQLYDLARRKGITGRSKMGKWDLIKAIRRVG